MKISELIKRLQSKQQKLGDLDVEISVYYGTHGFISANDITVEADDDKITIIDKI